MGWSYEDNRFEVTACEPKRASAGAPVTIAISGQNRGGNRKGEGWFALLVPADIDASAAPAEGLPAHFRATPVSYRHGEADAFSMSAAFELPADARGSYQLVVGHGDEHGAGELARFLVDADDFDGTFVVA